jgi:hypothetical protein
MFLLLITHWFELCLDWNFARSMLYAYLKLIYCTIVIINIPFDLMFITHIIKGMHIFIPCLDQNLPQLLFFIKKLRMLLAVCMPFPKPLTMICGFILLAYLRRFIWITIIVFYISNFRSVRLIANVQLWTLLPKFSSILRSHHFFQGYHDP